MILEEVRLKNFKSHRNSRIELGRGVTVIVGENGAGKTSILDAITYCLFKLKPEGVSMDELITLGERESEASVTFHANGRSYRVRRVRSHRHGSDAYLHQLGSGMETLVARGDREVTAEVERTLGLTSELFTTAVHIRQGEIDRLLTSDAAKRKQHIGRLIGTEDLERAYKSFLELIRPFEAKAAALSTAPVELEKVLEEKKKVEEEMAELREKLSELERRVEAEEHELEQVERELEELERMRREVEEERKMRMELSHLKERLERIEAYERELREVAGMKEKADRLEREVELRRERVKPLELVKARRDESERERKEVEESLAELRREIEAELKRASRILGREVSSIAALEKLRGEELSRLDDDVEEARKKIAAGERGVAEKKALLRSLEKARDELGSARGACPVCGRSLDEARKREILEGYEKEIAELERGIAEAGSEMEEWKGRLSEAEGKKDVLASISVEALSEKERRIRECESRISRLERQREEDEEAISRMQGIRGELQELEAELSRLRPYQERYIEATGFLRKNLPEKERLEERIGKAEEVCGELKARLEKRARELGVALPELAEAEKKAKERRRALVKALTELREERASLTSTMRWGEKRLGVLDKELSERKGRVKEFERLVEFKRFLERIRASFHKDALQKELRLRAKPLIEGHAREVFQRFNLPYTDLTVTEDFSLILHGDGGEETVDMLSGGERIAAALALRIGLSKALSGPVMELLVLDEPTVHLDEQRRRELVEVIKRLATIPQTIVVTHDREFEESADRIIEVKKVDGVSQVSSLELNRP